MHVLRTEFENTLDVVVRQAVIELSSLSPHAYQVLLPQYLKLMGDGRRVHAQLLRQVCYAHLTMVQCPQYLKPRAVRKYFEKICQVVNLFLLRHIFIDMALVSHGFMERDLL